MKEKESLLVIFSGLLFAACFISFGTIIGQVSFDPDSTTNVTDWIGAIGAMIGGLSTLALFVVGLLVVKNFRSQNKISALQEIKRDSLLLSKYVSQWAFEAAIVCNKPSSDEKVLELQSKVDSYMRNVLDSSAKLDAIQITRDFWVLDDAIKLERKLAEMYRYMNYPFHYEPMKKDSNGNLKAFDLDESILERNEKFLADKESLILETHKLVEKLDRLDQAIKI
ncbi:hypothetical protein QUO04_004121 [Vibrio vulnificus]|uniref:hypothetical protein n=1 Tax=Vibrio sp. 1078-1 TaxID=3074544 RepID=UPI001DE93AAC|nr:hypothetical protein [Vibrio sp. 1078-1]EHU4934975.1 hypothetical protein [Vibrio vulnificus]EIZ1460517.1 hypothetical protein [Vibrio vulnificus]EJE8572544.1 hypothetical protein [Vibrio vulnificus]ELP4435980.1 hypothetical protein [Vibrio vulnificus]ELP6736947.1 hypothetical protein [Vibrio vulnificus]